MKIGEKIRALRDLKNLSQANMASMLGLSELAYGEIERDHTDIKLSRLEQIAKVLGITVQKLLGFDDAVANFFENCSQANVFTGQNGNQSNYNDTKEFAHEIEKLRLEVKNRDLVIENLRLKLEKVEK
jgi:transcriptional regulator with XRE-family HTH domain